MFSTQFSFVEYHGFNSNDEAYFNILFMILCPIILQEGWELLKQIEELLKEIYKILLIYQNLISYNPQGFCGTWGKIRQSLNMFAYQDLKQ